MKYTSKAILLWALIVGSTILLQESGTLGSMSLFVEAFSCDITGGRYYDETSFCRNH